MKQLFIGDIYIGRDGIISHYPRGFGIDAAVIPSTDFVGQEGRNKVAELYKQHAKPEDAHAHAEQLFGRFEKIYNTLLRAIAEDNIIRFLENRGLKLGRFDHHRNPDNSIEAQFDDLKKQVISSGKMTEEEYEAMVGYAMERIYDEDGIARLLMSSLEEELFSYAGLSDVKDTAANKMKISDDLFFHVTNAFVDKSYRAKAITSLEEWIKARADLVAADPAEYAKTDQHRFVAEHFGGDIKAFRNYRQKSQQALSRNIQTLHPDILATADRLQLPVIVNPGNDVRPYYTEGHHRLHDAMFEARATAEGKTNINVWGSANTENLSVQISADALIDKSLSSKKNNLTRDTLAEEVIHSVEHHIRFPEEQIVALKGIAKTIDRHLAMALEFEHMKRTSAPGVIIPPMPAELEFALSFERTKIETFLKDKYGDTIDPKTFKKIHHGIMEQLTEAIGYAMDIKDPLREQAETVGSVGAAYLRQFNVRKQVPDESDVPALTRAYIAQRFPEMAKTLDAMAKSAAELSSQMSDEEIAKKHPHHFHTLADDIAVDGHKR